MRKRALFAVPASAFLLGIAEIPPAQSFNDDHLLNVAQSGVGKLAHAQTKYAVDGVVIGSQVDSATYLGYKCNPSDQFKGFTWCQKTRNDQDRRRGSTATYSILQDGNVVYVNRFQAPAFLNSNEADKEIQGYSHKLGETAHVIKIPHRAGLPDGIIALWGKTTLEPLDQESIKILATLRAQRRTAYRSTGWAVVQDFSGLPASIRRIEARSDLQRWTHLDCLSLSQVKPRKSLYPRIYPG